MPRLPVLGRLRSREYTAILLGFLIVVSETLLTCIISFLPKSVIQWFYDRSKSVFHLVVGPPKPRTDEERLSDRIRRARDFEKLCEIFGYTFEEHVLLTKDGYLLGLHRLCHKQGERRAGRVGTSTGKPVVYLHHGLLMNSEVWICLTQPQRCIPFVLVEMGFDVWLGNNRGNKYSKKSIYHDPNSSKFWNYSIDDFAWHDIPESIDYILDVTKEPSLSYIGFSQGSAQAFAALSIHPPLNERVNVFIALAPAMSPAGLSAPIVDGLMKASCVANFSHWRVHAANVSTVAPRSCSSSSVVKPSFPLPPHGSPSSTLPSSPPLSTRLFAGCSTGIATTSQTHRNSLHTHISTRLPPSSPSSTGSRSCATGNSRCTTMTSSR